MPNSTIPMNSAVKDFMSKKSKATLLDKMEALGLNEMDMKAIQRLPITIESQMRIVDNLIYTKIMKDKDLNEELAEKKE